MLAWQMGVLINAVDFLSYGGVRYNIWPIDNHSAQLLHTLAVCGSDKTVVRVVKRDNPVKVLMVLQM